MNDAKTRRLIQTVGEEVSHLERWLIHAKIVDTRSSVIMRVG